MNIAMQTTRALRPVPSSRQPASTVHLNHQQPSRAFLRPNAPTSSRKILQTACSIAEEKDFAAQQANCDSDNFPTELEGAPDSLFPLRQPGAFPETRLEDEPVVEAEYDPLRDGPLRYLGYSNECGEAFAAWIPSWGVPFSYAVAVAYVLVDTYDKGSRAYREAEVELAPEKNIDPSVNTKTLTQLLSFERALDTVVWQLLASVILPGYTIHTIVALTHAGLAPLEATDTLKQAFENLAVTFNTSSEVLLGLFDKTLPTMVGLGAIPFIVHPLDNGVHAAMNATIRPAMKKMICQSGGGMAGLAMCSDNCEVE